MENGGLLWMKYFTLTDISIYIEMEITLESYRIAQGNYIVCNGTKGQHAKRFTGNLKD